MSFAVYQHETLIGLAEMNLRTQVRSAQISNQLFLVYADDAPASARAATELRVTLVENASCSADGGLKRFRGMHFDLPCPANSSFAVLGVRPLDLNPL